jgi:hypothetical protein
LEVTAKQLETKNMGTARDTGKIAGKRAASDLLFAYDGDCPEVDVVLQNAERLRS